MTKASNLNASLKFLQYKQSFTQIRLHAKAQYEKFIQDYHQAQKLC
jgi:hypothetical protein